MRHFLLSVVALVLLPVAAAFAAPQDEAPTKTEEAKAFVSETKKGASKLEELAAKAAITRLVEIWNDAEVEEGAKKDIPAILEKIAMNKQAPTALSGIDGLTQIRGNAAAKALMKVLQKQLKAKEPGVQIYSASLKGLGSIASEDAKVVKELVKLLKHKNYDIVGKTAQALAGYKDAAGKLRKELLEEVIKQSEGVYNAAQNNDSNMKRKWNIVQNGIMKALKALSGQSFSNPADARSWYNDNKKNRDLWK